MFSDPPITAVVALICLTALPAQAAAAPDLAARKLGVWQPRATGYAVLSDLGSGSSNTGYDAVTGVLGLGTEQSSQAW